MTKKFLSILLALSMTLTMLAACNTEDPVVEDNPDDGQQQEEVLGDEQKNISEPEQEEPVKVLNLLIPPESEPYTADPNETVLKLDISSSGNSETRSVVIPIEEFEIPAGSTLEYDVYLEKEASGVGFFDIMINGIGFISATVEDSACIGMDHYGEISDFACKNWYHRTFKLPASETSLEVKKAAFRILGLTEGCNYTYYFDNICIKDSSGNVVKEFKNEDLIVPVAESGGIVCTLEVTNDPAPDKARKTIEDFAYFHEAEGTLTGSDVIEMTVSLNDLDSCPAIYLGTKDGSALYGFNGYAFCLTSDEVFLYRLSDKLYQYASMSAVGVDVNEDQTIRLEYDGTYLRGYFLDDAEGYEPWPEFEITADNLIGAEYGVMNLRGGSSTVKSIERTDYVAKTVENPFSNPVIAADSPDPDVLYYDSMYYLYSTAYRYSVYQSPDLVNWEYVGTCVDELTWDIEDKNWWAPDVEEYNGKFYMMASANHKLGLAVSDSPVGPFVTVGEPFFTEFSIDGHLFIDDDGTAYVYFNGENFADAEYPASIYGMKIDLETYTIDKSTLTSLIHPEGWERRRGESSPGTTEGPYILKHNGLYYLIYSGNAYENERYAVGYAVSESPLGPFVKYEGNPIMRSTSNIMGPGHNSFAEMPNGEIYIVYHHWSNIPGVSGRIVAIDKIRFSPTESGVDRLEFHAPQLSPQEYPVSVTAE